MHQLRNALDILKATILSNINIWNYKFIVKFLIFNISKYV